MNADSSIENAAGEIPNIMCSSLCDGKTIANLEFEGVRMILSLLDPKKFDQMPNTYRYRTQVETEAWLLMEQGRNMYTELPKCLSTKPLFVIGNSTSPHMSFNMDKNMTWDVVNKTFTKNPRPPPVYWLKKVDENGTEYFYNETTRAKTYVDPSTPLEADHGIYVVPENENFLEAVEKEYFDFLQATDGMYSSIFIIFTNLRKFY